MEQQKQSNEQIELTEVGADHALNPRNYGRLSRCDGRARITGPCGDTMEFWVQVQGARLERCTFITNGCAPSLASGSMATELAAGRTVEEALGIQQKDILEALGGLPQEVEHCALLAANTLQAACNDFLQHRQPATVEQSHQAARQATMKATIERREVGSCEGCGREGCSAKDRRQGESEKEYAERQKLRRRLCRIEHKILVLSGKGGVGKSTVAVNLAVALMLDGKRVGLLDVDIHGPSVPMMLNLNGEPILGEGGALLPVELGELKVMSIGFLLRRREEAVIWRGPMKMGVIKQFLSDVEWGDLDYLIVDAPPGTGDEPLSVCQLIEDADGALIITTPQEVALESVRKSVSFCRQLGLRVLGVVENMSGFVCPKCGERTEIFLSGGGERMAREMKVPFLGRIPIEPRIALYGDSGRPFIQVSSPSEGSRAFAAIVRAILDGEATAVAAPPDDP
jgi:ATP-binding protein involved in chromosome partitioning